MGSKNKKISLVALAVLFALGAQAQSLPDPIVQAVRKAVTTNPEVQARWNGFKAAGNERDVARGGYFPQLDLTATTGREENETPQSQLRPLRLQCRAAHLEPDAV